MKFNLAFSGGGMKGIAYIGSLKYIEESKIQIKAASGTSAGAIFAYFTVLGLKYKQIKNIFYKVNLGEFQNLSVDNLLLKFGLDDGKKITDFLKAMITATTGKESTTFGELYEKTKKELVIVGSCIDQECAGPEYFTYKTHPNMKLVDALRITISIPIYYEYCIYENKRYVDGALFDNLPSTYFNDQDNTISFKLNDNSELDCSTLDKYIFHLLNTAVFAMQNKKLKKNIITINTNNNILNFNLTNEEKDILIDIGYNATKSFFESFQPLHRDFTGRRNSI
jgi:predicted acylesterase/phospholipase RssA